MKTIKRNKILFAVLGILLLSLLAGYSFSGPIVSLQSSTGSSDAPTDAKYIVQQLDATLSAEQAMGALGTGAVWNTNTTGVQSISAGLTSIGGLTETNGGIPYGTADNAYDWLAAGAQGTLLMGNGAGAPSWLAAGTAGYFLLGAGVADPVWTTQPTLTNLEGLTLTNGDIIYASGADTFVVLDHGTANYILQANGVAAPSWVTAPTISGANITGIPLDGDFGSNGIMERTAAGTYGIATAGTDYTTASSTDEFTNKTFDASGTGNALKVFGYIQLINPHLAGSGVEANMDTTATNEFYGQVKFADEIDVATNYCEYRLAVPADFDTAVDLTASFKFRLGGADTADHDYVISHDTVADSADYTGTLTNAVNLAYTADGDGADGDVETASGTLTDWKDNLTAGNLWVIRVARDGDDGTNDASTVDSYSGPLVIRYGVTQ